MITAITATAAAAESERLYLDRIASPLGKLLVVCDGEQRLRALDFADCEARMRQLLAAACRSGPAPAAVLAAIEAFFAGSFAALDRLAVCARGTPFQQRVWSALRAIPAGSTLSYGELAARVGQPGAARAVGLANRANPIAIVVPCHRVIGKSGALTGYAGGLSRKRWLLAHERASLGGRE